MENITTDPEQIKNELRKLIQEKTERDYEETIREVIDGREYALVATDRIDTTYLRSFDPPHLHFGEAIWLVYKPKKRVRWLDSKYYGDFMPEKRAYTPITLREEVDKTIIIYDDRYQLGRMREFRWVKSIEQGRSEPKFHIKEIKRR